MNILFVSIRKDYSGGEICLERIITLLPDKSFVILPEGPFAKRLRELGVAVFIENNLCQLNRKDDNFALIKYPFRLLPAVQRIIQKIKLEKIDLIVANGIGPVPYAGLSGLLTNTSVIWIQNHPVLKPKTFMSFMAKRISALTRKIITVSKAMEVSLEKAGISKDKLITIYNGIDSNLVNSNPPESTNPYKLNENTIVVGLIGMITHIKGFHIAVSAAKQLKREGYSNIKFLFIGEVFENSKTDRKYKEDLLDEINKADLCEQIIFTGKLEGLSKIYGNLDIVLNCSVEPEPLGTTIYEGMLFNKLVIATNIGGSPELVENDKTGFLIPPNEPTQLCNLLKSILSNPNGFKHIKDNGRDFVLKKLSIEKTVEEYRSVFLNATC